MNTRFQLALVILAVSISCACKKNDPPAAPQKIYLVKETIGAVTRDYKYDNQNRFLGMAYRDATNHQETFTTQFHSSGQPQEAILRDYVFNRASSYTYAYDAQNRCTKVEVKDSVSPGTFTLRTTYNFIYAANKVTRAVTNASTGTGPRQEYTIDANSNYI
jgi:hypothetical protein